MLFVCLFMCFARCLCHFNKKFFKILILRFGAASRKSGFAVNVIGHHGVT